MSLILPGFFGMRGRERECYLLKGLQNQVEATFSDHHPGFAPSVNVIIVAVFFALLDSFSLLLLSGICSPFHEDSYYMLKNFN